MDNLQNIMGLMAVVVAIVSVAITVLAVYVAYLLSRSYLQNIQELQVLSKNTQELGDRLANLTQTHASLLSEALLAVRSIFDLLMLSERRAGYESLSSRVASQKVWKGRKLTDDEASGYLTRIGLEIDGINRAVLARQTEIYWLVGQDTEQAAHLHALYTTHGDGRSIELLESIREFRMDPQQRDELLIAISRLRERLGRPARSKPVHRNGR